MLPSLQDDQRTADQQASLQVERARRLLDRYEPRLAYKALLLEDLEALLRGECEEAAKREGREEPADCDPWDAAVLQNVLRDETAADEYQVRHEHAWTTYEPKNYGADPKDYRVVPPGKAPRPNYGNLVRRGQEGIRQRDLLLDDNQKLLDEALTAVNQALGVTSGDASTRSHAEANRLKAVILYHKGLAARLRAGIRRGIAEPFRRQLVALAIRAAEHESSTNLVADSGIIEQITSLQEKAAEADAKSAEDRNTAAALAVTIEDLQHRLVSARSMADAARQTMDELKAKGIDFSDAQGGEAFGKELLELDRSYRDAMREAQALEFGTYPSARLDRGGDYLTGPYVENGSTEDLSIEYGLNHYLDQQTILAARIEAEQRATDDLRSDIARLVGIKLAQKAAQERARRTLVEVREEAEKAFTELNRIESEAWVIEEDALSLLGQSAAASTTAARSADKWVSDAAAKTREMSASAKGRSAHASRQDDSWMAGYIGAQTADAHVAKAWVFYERYSAANQTAGLLAEVAEALGLTEADAGSERVKAREARDGGVADVQQAVAELQTAHGKVGRHWTIVAQEAGAIYLLYLFGYDNYLDEAIEAYRSALKGREDADYTDRLRARLTRLEKR